MDTWFYFGSLNFHTRPVVKVESANIRDSMNDTNEGEEENSQGNGEGTKCSADIGNAVSVARGFPRSRKDVWRGPPLRFVIGL